MATLTPPAPVTLREFDEIFGRWRSRVNLLRAWYSARLSVTIVQGHDIDIGSSTVTFATDYLGIAFQRGHQAARWHG